MPARTSGSGGSDPSPRCCRSPLSRPRRRSRAAASAARRAPPGHENDGIWSPNRRPDRRRGLRRRERRGAAQCRPARVRTTVGVMTMSNSRRRARRVAPSPAAPAGRATRSGTILFRARLRARHSAVVRREHDARRWQVRARAPARSILTGDPRSRPSVSTTVVSPRPMRWCTICSSSANASVLAARSSSLSPTIARKRSLETICSGAKCVCAQVDFPAPDGPTRTTRQGDGRTTSSSTTPFRPCACPRISRRGPPVTPCPSPGCSRRAPSAACRPAC